MSIDLHPWLLVHGDDAESRLEYEAGRGDGRRLPEGEGGRRLVDGLEVAGDAEAVEVGAPVPLHGHVLADGRQVAAVDLGECDALT